MAEQDAATVTTPTGPEATTSITAEQEPKPEVKATDWEGAYKGLQTNLNRRDQRIDSVLAQNLALMGVVETLKGDVETILKQTVGEDGLRARQTERHVAQERQQALVAAETSKQYVAASIEVLASAMKAAGVPESDIQSVFTTSGKTRDIAEWAEVAKSETAAAIAKVKSAETSKAQAKSQDEIKVEAQALAERTLRTKGIDKVDLGRGQSITPERDLVTRIKSIDRSTDEGEKAWQALRKDVIRGTLAT